jgi:hypothetical protein
LRPYGRGGEDLSVFLYPEYRPVVREAVADLLKSVWPEMGAPVTAINPYVEANLMVDDEGRYYVAVVNYSGKPLELELTIDASQASNPREAKAEFCNASVSVEEDAMRINLPIDMFDFITLAPY